MSDPPNMLPEDMNLCPSSPFFPAFPRLCQYSITSAPQQKKTSQFFWGGAENPLTPLFAPLQQQFDDACVVSSLGELRALRG